MTELTFLVEVHPDGGLTASAVGRSIVTQAVDERELRALVRDVVRCHYGDEEPPERIRLRFLREDVVLAV
ncbi:MAG: hypothetical protein U1E45_07235 [Geminicoccaceae bacterium]